MNINNLPKPKFEEFVGGFRVTLFKSPQKTAHITTQKTTREMTLREKILSVIRDNPDVTRNGIAEFLKISPNTVKEYIAKLKKKEKLKRIGPDRGGHWEVVE
jgi:ATP-dependent DNA helicase RecG